ncbi:MAG: amidohydrolase [Leptolyngbyaceae cyanobacterium T60_A2020_046]|nr:amidohydrolase [Leptolyngbyaceae cyanobacterium T60_A2020_046]
MLDQICAIVDRLEPRLIEIRRHLHSHPELSGQEYQTAAYVSGVLSSYGLKTQELVGKTGVVADLPGAGEQRGILALRTDMDGLPILERADVEFISQKAGIMHACGHDVHTTVGLGAAMVLAELGVALPGTVRFIFQPAEETAQGARWMVADGVMEGVSAIFGVHVYPSILGGDIGIRYGALTAAADDLEIHIVGESGHGARPHEATDAIWIAAQVITVLQQSISRTHNPLRPVVLTIGQIQGGRAPNVIADHVKLRGTVRSLHPDTRTELPDWIERIVAGVCQPYGAKYQVDYRLGVPSVMNDPGLTQIVEFCAEAACGREHVQLLAEPSLGAEDFSVYLDHAPGTMFRLGVGYPNQVNHPLHHPQFEVNERAIAVGVKTLAYALCRYWEQGHNLVLSAGI